MGNTVRLASVLRTAISNGNDYQLDNTLDRVADSNISLDKLSITKGGLNALQFSVKCENLNAFAKLILHGCDPKFKNKYGLNALDYALDNFLPTDHTIAHGHPQSHASNENIAIGRPIGCIHPVIKLLLENGVHSVQMSRLVMANAKYPRVIEQIITITPWLLEDTKLSALLLQISVWFEQDENLILLLNRGVSVDLFWLKPFMPMFYHNLNPDGDSYAAFGDYTLPDITETKRILHLKFAWVVDWRLAWQNGDNPKEQHRASLNITPSAAMTFIQASNNVHTFEFILSDIFSYHPLAACGPDLSKTPLVDLLTFAGHIFTSAQMEQLKLMFGLNFHDYHRFIQKPQPLRHLARLCIRRSMTTNVFCATNELELPQSLKEYICLNML